MDQRTLAVQCLPGPKPWPKCGLLGHVASEHQESTEVCQFLPCACRTNIISVQGCCRFGCPWVGMQCIQTFQVLSPYGLLRYISCLRKHKQTTGDMTIIFEIHAHPGCFADSSKPPSVVGSCECMKWGKALARSAQRAVKIGLNSTIPDAIETYVFVKKNHNLLCRHQHICVWRKEKDLCVGEVATWYKDSVVDQ